MSIEELLVGTPLLMFLQELAAIKDEEIVDDLPPIKEGEIPLGDMTPFEKRLNLWVDRRAEKEDSIRAEALSGDGGTMCLSAYEFGAETSRRFALLGESVPVRYPQIKTTNCALRQGFKIVTNVRAENPLATEFDIAHVLAIFTGHDLSGRKPR